ncbi:MAG: lipid II:glycine glycyltransferase FemX [Spirochaetota bacterium]
MQPNQSERGEVAAPAGPRAWHFLQSELWARHKERFGWRAVRVEGPEPILTLSRPLAAGFVLTYVPYAPAAVPYHDSVGSDCIPGVPGPAAAELGRQVAVFIPMIRAAVESAGLRLALIRFDLPQSDDGSFSAVLPDGQLVRAPVEVQPPTTVIVDLDRDEERILAAMHKKNRYNIRLAERKAVRVRRATADELPRWYELYEETARRDAIAIHSFAYYAHLFELASSVPEPRLVLYLAEHEGEVLAGIIVVHHGDGATYLYGASSDRKRNLMPNYALQWHAMQAARAEGMRWYDFFGIPPADDPSHPMHGLYRFKTGFGGAIVSRLGAWDVPLRPVASRAFRLAERARDFYFHRMRKHVVR